jgi:hypothetical protein
LSAIYLQDLTKNEELNTSTAAVKALVRRNTEELDGGQTPRWKQRSTMVRQ